MMICGTGFVDYVGKLGKGVNVKLLIIVRYL